MMDIEQNLFWEKYRPQTLEELIMPERIRAYVKDGIPGNLIFAGTAGMGKTSLARVLAQEYPTLPLAANLGVDVLRDRVKNFCSSVGQISFDEEEDADAPFRIVYFEEFDRATKQLQEELKSFMDEYSDRVRFIATTNSTKGMDKNLLSRFKILDFSSTSPEDVREMKLGYYRRVQECMKIEGANVPREVLAEIINKHYPDFRQVWQDVQYFVKTGIKHLEVGGGDERLFELIMQPVTAVTPTENWDYLNEAWLDKINIAFQELGRNFFAWVKKNHPNKLGAMPEALNVYSEYVDLRLPNAMDPFVTLCALVHKYQAIFQK